MHVGTARGLGCAVGFISRWMGRVGEEHGRGCPIARVQLVERLVSYTAAACGVRVVAAGDGGTSETGGDCRRFGCDLVESIAASRRLAAAVVPAIVEGQRCEFGAG